MEDCLTTKLRGELSLDIYEDGHFVRSIRESNQITQDGISSFFASILDPEKQIHLSNVRVGTSSGENLRTLSDLRSERSDQSSSEIESRSIEQTPSAIVASHAFTISENVHVGKWIRELGLFFTDQSMFSRFIISDHNQFQKTERIKILGRWKIFYIQENTGAWKISPVPIDSQPPGWTPTTGNDRFCLFWWDTRAQSEGYWVCLTNTVGDITKGLTSDFIEDVDGEFHQQKTKVVYNEHSDKWILYCDVENEGPKYIGPSGDLSPIGIYSPAETEYEGTGGEVYRGPIDEDTGEYTCNCREIPPNTDNYRITAIANTDTCGINDTRDTGGNRIVLDSADIDDPAVTSYQEISNSTRVIQTDVYSSSPINYTFNFLYESNRFAITEIGLIYFISDGHNIEEYTNLNLLTDSIPSDLGFDLIENSNPNRPTDLEIPISPLFEDGLDGEDIFGVRFSANYKYRFIIESFSDLHTSISPSGTTYVFCGGDQNYEITVDSGYTNSIYVDGERVTEKSSYEFTDVGNDHTIRAVSYDACFEHSPDTPCVGSELSFNGECSWGGYSDVSSYSWDFGDGNTGTGETITHTYSSSGDYLITLKIETGLGDTDKSTKNLSVGACLPTSCFSSDLVDCVENTNSCNDCDPVIPDIIYATLPPDLEGDLARFADNTYALPNTQGDPNCRWQKNLSDAWYIVVIEGGGSWSVLLYDGDHSDPKCYMNWKSTWSDGVTSECDPRGSDYTVENCDSRACEYDFYFVCDNMWNTPNGIGNASVSYQ